MEKKKKILTPGRYSFPRQVGKKSRMLQVNCFISLKYLRFELAEQSGFLSHMDQVNKDLMLRCVYTLRLIGPISYLGACYIYTKVTKCIREKMTMCFRE